MESLAVLFDLDGTLINTLPDIVGVVNRVREDLELKPYPSGLIAAHIGKGAQALIQGCFADVLDSYGVPVLVERFRSRYYEEPHHGGQVYPGVEATLDRLVREGIQIGIATNKPERAALVTLKHYLPRVRFQVVACPENVSEKKPSPKHLTEPLGLLGVPPGKAVFVGDDPVDLIAAREASVKFLGVSFGFGGVKAPIMLAEFPELLDYLAPFQ